MLKELFLWKFNHLIKIIFIFAVQTYILFDSECFYKHLESLFKDLYHFPKMSVTGPNAILRPK